MNILLTGASGFIGKGIYQFLRDKGLFLNAPNRTQLNLLNRANTFEYIRLNHIDTILHFATRGVGANPHDLTLISEERTMAENIAYSLPEGGRMFYAGSMSEYGVSGILHEQMVCRPVTAYGRSKLEAGEWLRSYAKKSGIKVIVGRIFGAYGYYEKSDRLFPYLLKNIRENRTSHLSDCEQIRDFIHIEDIASAVYDLITLSNPPECVNIGTGEGVKVKCVIERFSKELNYQPTKLLFGSRERSQHDFPILIASTDIMKKTIGKIPPQRLTTEPRLLPLFQKDAD